MDKLIQFIWNVLLLFGAIYDIIWTSEIGIYSLTFIFSLLAIYLLFKIEQIICKNWI